MSNSTKVYVAVVDDDESLCRSLSRLLRAAGIQPVSYLSAEAFLADSRRPQFHCLVLDIQLGGISGIELKQQLAPAAWSIQRHNRCARYRVRFPTIECAF